MNSIITTKHVPSNTTTKSCLKDETIVCCSKGSCSKSLPQRTTQLRRKQALTQKGDIILKHRRYGDGL
ncbi:hypothetical protein Scep_019646 [Stephania cephalantha]|uniref:Uncharacterized protein n=1 Tax=Stephania cephalantha TaxID=152367 RepID=A0AAP0IBP7_9MAGN